MVLTYYREYLQDSNRNTGQDGDDIQNEYRLPSEGVCGKEEKGNPQGNKKGSPYGAYQKHSQCWNSSVVIVGEGRKR